MKKNLLILALVLFNTTFSQKKIDSLYVKYFETKREIPYLHLNKTSFVPGEEIWFKAYVLNNKTKKLSQFTRNLHCYLYDENRKIVKKKMLYVQNGLANGNFKIDSTLTNSTYYLASSTNWMQNFNEDETFYQKITILKGKKEKKVLDNDYDVQILPEGGHHIVASINTFGLIIKDKNNKGIKTNSILLKDDKHKTLQKISSNNFGLGKFSFYYKPNKEYYLEIDFGTHIIKKKIPKADQLGLTLTIENTAPTYFIININTNKKTLRTIKNKSFKILIHNTNYFLEKDLIFNGKNITTSLIIPKKKIDTGVSIITLFDANNNPISERLTYIHSKKIIKEINIKKRKITKDSIEIEFSKKAKDSISYLMSISILPINTLSYHPQHSIISKFLLSPYLKGDIQNPSYYFNDINREKLSELDLLLLTQGWSKYSWKNIFYNTPLLNTKSENGIDIKGTLNVKKINKKAKIFLFSPDNNLVLTKELEGNKIEFSRLYLKDSSDVNFVISSKNRTKKTTGYFHQIFNNHNYKTKTYPYQFELKNNYEVSNFIKNDRIKLNAIELKVDKKPENNPFFLGFSDVFMPDDNNNGFRNISSFLNQNGYSIRNTEEFYEFIIMKRNRSVSVFWDDFLYDGDLNILLNMNVNEFSEIHYSNEAIHLFSNYEYRKSNSIKKHNKINIKNGYAEPIEYYQPKYETTTSDLFEKFGAVYWIPNIALDEQNKRFKIPLLNQKRISLFIEGFTTSGKYIYEKKNIYLE